MPLLPDEFEQVEQIARQVAKKEVEVVGKDLDMIVKKLETKITDLQTEIKKAGQSVPADIEISKVTKKGAFKSR